MDNAIVNTIVARGFVLNYEDTQYADCTLAIFAVPDPTNDEPPSICVSPWPNPREWTFYASGSNDMCDCPGSNGAESLNTFLNYLDETPDMGDPRERVHNAKA